MEQRVQLKDGSMSGVVLERKDGMTRVKWGTSNRVDFSDWVEDERLEAYPHPVYSGDPETGRKDKVYDPAVEPWTS